MKDDTIINGIGCVWAVGAISSVAVTAVIIWAIVKLVAHFT